jgi:hypothetical protein
MNKKSVEVLSEVIFRGHRQDYFVDAAIPCWEAILGKYDSYREARECVLQGSDEDLMMIFEDAGLKNLVGSDKHFHSIRAVLAGFVRDRKVLLVGYSSCAQIEALYGNQKAEATRESRGYKRRAAQYGIPLILGFSSCAQIEALYGK